MLTYTYKLLLCLPKRLKKKFIIISLYSYIIMTWFAFLIVLIRILCFVLNKIEITGEKRIGILNESQALSIHVIGTCNIF